jgi:hypothetical protein
MEASQQLVQAEREAKELVGKAKQSEAEARQAAASVAELQSAVRKAEQSSVIGESPVTEELPQNSDEASVSQFVGRWRIGDEKGQTASFFTLTKSFDAKKSYAPTVTAKWEIVGNEARITWSDGWRDILRPQKGSVLKIAFQPGTSWDEKPANTQRAVKE